jgi:hypothetical protein
MPPLVGAFDDPERTMLKASGEASTLPSEICSDGASFTVSRTAAAATPSRIPSAGGTPARQPGGGR